MYAIYISHPQVMIDPAIPVPQWGLSPVGRVRAERFARADLLVGVERIISSHETKALQTATILATHCGGRVEARDGFGENDRSATGFVPEERFEELADAFFARPDQSVEGWERAADAPERIVKAITEALRDSDPDHPIAFVGHGAVGTLLKCHLAGRPIARSEDQPGNGGGNAFTFSLGDMALLTEWMPFEAFERPS
jgi:broad specificity phosphatase PhoE